MRPRSLSLLLSVLSLALGLAACGSTPPTSTTPTTPAATEEEPATEAAPADEEGDATQRGPKGAPPNDPCGGGE